MGVGEGAVHGARVGAAPGVMLAVGHVARRWRPDTPDVYHEAPRRQAARPSRADEPCERRETRRAGGAGSPPARGSSRSAGRPCNQAALDTLRTDAVLPDEPLTSRYLHRRAVTRGSGD